MRMLRDSLGGERVGVSGIPSSLRMDEGLVLVGCAVLAGLNCYDVALRAATLDARVAGALRENLGCDPQPAQFADIRIEPVWMELLSALEAHMPTRRAQLRIVDLNGYSGFVISPPRPPHTAAKAIGDLYVWSCGHEEPDPFLSLRAATLFSAMLGISKDLIELVANGRQALAPPGTKDDQWPPPPPRSPLWMRELAFRARG